MTSTQSKLYAWWHREVHWVCTTGAGSFRFIPKVAIRMGAAAPYGPGGSMGAASAS